MALHKDFPTSPHAILDPSIRWFPADEARRKEGYHKLLPPLVAKLRKKVKDWRNTGYEGCTETSKQLLNWWFQTEHPMQNADGDTFLFEYYFAQREALETLVYLYDVAGARNPLDLLRYDSSGAISTGMFPEDWLRLVIKMATGSGKTKVLSLILAWCYFHKMYEEGSRLARNFLVIAPNIIVLDRIRADFDNLKIFSADPVLPDNGYMGRNWREDFQLTLHIQDQLGHIRKTGNIFLTNIHRVYDSSESTASFEDEDTKDYFLGKRPMGKTNESKVNLSDIVRDIDELVILNDEAHHIHDERMAWFKSIEDIHNKLKMKGDFLSLQVDVTATPKHNNGGIFVQTVSDYPLVEAIHQNVVKHPIVPDPASRAKLQEQTSSKFTEKYRDFIHVGVEEWKMQYERHIKMGKKAILFVMTDDTRNCDEVKEYLQRTYAELNGRVLVIHTKDNGEIAESSSGKKAEELEQLRKEANEIDSMGSHHLAIVSVLMLKEGWDVKNVTTIVGLRAFSSKSNILPEQTLGRGLRRMYRGEDISEEVSVVGTDAFLDFVESIKSEGVELEQKSMGAGTGAKAPLVIEVDRENTSKNIDELDIEIPVLSPRIYREYKNLSELDVSSLIFKPVELLEFGETEKKDITFKKIVTDEFHHVISVDTTSIPNYQSAIGYFAQQIMKELRLYGGFDILCGKVKLFIQDRMFGKTIVLDDDNILRNLSEPIASKTITETFQKSINALTVQDKGEAEIKDTIKISKSRPFVMKDQGVFIPKKSLFNKIVGDSNLELEFASVLDSCEDIISYAKNYFSINFKIEYSNASGDISYYHPDFLVKVSAGETWIVETKGREDLDDIEKIKRLRQWCDDVNHYQKKVKFNMLYIKQDDWEKLKKRPTSFSQVIQLFVN